MGPAGCCRAVVGLSGCEEAPGCTETPPSPPQRRGCSVLHSAGGCRCHRGGLGSLGDALQNTPERSGWRCGLCPLGCSPRVRTGCCAAWCAPRLALPCRGCCWCCCTWGQWDAALHRAWCSTWVAGQALHPCCTPLLGTPSLGGLCMQNGPGDISPAAGLHPKCSPIAVIALLCMATYLCAGLCSCCSSRGIARGPRCARASHLVRSHARQHCPHSAKGSPFEKHQSRETTGMLLGAGREFLMPCAAVLGGSSASQSGAAGPHRLFWGCMAGTRAGGADEQSKQRRVGGKGRAELSPFCSLLCFFFFSFLFFFFPFFIFFFLFPSLWVERWGDRQGKSEQWSLRWCCLQSPRPRIPRSGPSRHKGLQRKSAAAAASESTRARLGLWHRQESKKLGEAGKERGESNVPCVFFPALPPRGCVSERRFLGTGGGCAAMPPGSSLNPLPPPPPPPCAVPHRPRMWQGETCRAEQHREPAARWGQLLARAGTLPWGLTCWST
ncbi:uncharacterized protein LOC128088507 [Tympanuchus pallidicinctus]|uniref:uncharacterized protein LOC128088507 n=1 Tax=Tympanuchus pallidicinctus TaxID=109042 RepID=UPI002286D573|nr:uncharacterized protein LOC128088507 [Tympanuchus pallidicinctus]